MGERHTTIESLADSLRRPASSLGSLACWSEEELREFRQLIDTACNEDAQVLDAEIDRLFWLRALRFWLRRQRGAGA